MVLESVQPTEKSGETKADRSEIYIWPNLFVVLVWAMVTYITAV